MRAVEFTGYGSSSVVQIAEVAEPHAGPGQVRVAVRSSGVSPGEVRLRSGAMREFAPLTFPYRSGFDAAGVVDEVGEGLTGVKIGDDVFGWPEFSSRGANAEYVVLAAWAPKPRSWPWEEAGGAAGSVETSVRVLDRLGVKRGDTVLVQGAAGGTGSVIVQFALARGATVIGTASESNHEFLRSLGVTPTTYGPGLDDRVGALAPEGVDAVIDCAGGSLPELIAIAADAARVVTIADLGAADQGVFLSSGMTDTIAVRALGEAVALADAGVLRIPVAATFALDDVAVAHDLVEGRHARGKVVLVPIPAH